MAIVNPNPEEIQDILKRSKRIAVVGLSDNPMRTSYQVAKHMLDAGYTIVPVNPTVEKVFGLKAFPSLKDIDGHVDIVNVFRRSEYLPEVAKETAEISADVFWAQLGLANEAAYDYLKERNITVIMDRCIKVEHASIRE
ncbi:putative CoA-binding protein [Scopulibacillus darangshiensis]|uniref:Putative CoA-binding protein n=1 Tax=Scopulibacillus darangshiensis TaxID=442528 RepID=A0A4R2PBM8_9BACL|nr:CoA-binding protein [Scopulibacillus darangshiensis]TCP31531.1 putative CoA-binding protein [Scopulibacillus darangshiensis]